MAYRILAGSLNPINLRRNRGSKKDRTHRRDRLTAAIRPVIEILETRCLLSAAPVVYVNSAWAGSATGSDPGTLGAGNSFGYDEFADIQDGVNAVAAGGTVEVDNGSYSQSNIVVSQAMTIQGQSQSGVVLSPSMTDSHDDSAFGGTASNGFVIAASGVTIEDLTIDGGANQNFRAGVITNSANDANTYSDTNIQDVTINNTFRQGVALYNFTGTSTGNVVENDTFNNVGSIINDSGNAYQLTAAIGLFQSSGQVENNTITNSAAGIVGTTFDGSSQSLTVTGNSYTSAATVLTNGALGIDLAHLAGGSAVSGNTVDLTGTGTAGNDNAIVVSFDQGTVAVNDNTITGQDNDNGIVLFQDGSDVTLDSNTIEFGGDALDNGTGILLTDQSSDTSLFGAAPGAVSATLTNDSVLGFNIGVWLRSSGDAVNATIGDPNNSANANSILGDNTGVEVDGSGADATITNNFSTAASDIEGCVVGVAVNGGTASIQDNYLLFDDTAIQVVAGTANVDVNNFISDGNPGSPNTAAIEVDNGTMTADNNLFFDTTGDEIYVSNSANTPVVTAYDNAFYLTQNYTAIDNENPNVTVDARLNYWGSNQMTATDIEAENIGSIAFAPWIDSAPSASQQTMQSPGFFGAFSALDVSSQGAQIGSVSPIQQAINDLTPGGVITVDDGTYNTNLDITKALSIQSVDGAAATTISDPTSPTGAITIESGVSGVDISGLTIVANTSPWALNILGSNATITDSVFESTGSGNVQTADNSDTITGNTFIAPSPSDETGFEQYNDTAPGYDSSGEITGLLANNTFNRAYTVQDSSGDYVRTIFADPPPVQATPTITVNPVNITYGTALANGQLSGTASYTGSGGTVTVAGTFAYTSAAGTVLGAGSGQSEAVTFTPTDTTDYSTANGSATVNVAQATPRITVKRVSITYGTALTNGQLGGTASYAVGGSTVTVAGTFAYTSAAGTVLGAGNGQSEAVTFTPTDTTDYTTATGSVTVNVAKATPTITVNPVNITYGTALDNGQLSGTASFTVGGSTVTVAGTFAYTSAAGKVLGAGNGQSKAVTFTPNDTTDYTNATGSVIVNVAKATPTITASAGSTVVVGTGMKLTASAMLAGGYNEAGKITFTLYAPSGSLVNTETASVTGPGTYVTPSGYLPTVAGTYQWVASYGGDANNIAASTLKGATPESAVA